MTESVAAVLTLLGITVLVLGYILQPLRAPRADRGVSAGEALRLQYERVLSMLHDLETDWRTGKIPEEDYRALRQRYLEEGAALLRALREEPGDLEAEARVEAAVRARRAQLRRKHG